MEIFDDIGRGVTLAWRQRNFDERVFSAVAVDVLSRLRPCDHTSADDIAEWVLHADALPPQGDLRNAFGMPPVVVYRDERFYIEALFWVDSSTVIHQHGFSGAFHVMCGSSLHSVFSFREQRRYSDQLLLGELTLEETEVLEVGDTRAINCSNRLVHSLFHLAKPTISIVVRTGKDPTGGVQYDYDRSGIAHNPFFMTDCLKRKLQVLEMSKAIDHPQFVARARDVINRADPFSAFHLLNTAGRVATANEYESILQGVTAHPELRTRVLLKRIEAAREAFVVSRRARVRDDRHRLFLALLLNLTARAEILRMIAMLFPLRKPQEMVILWIEELTKVNESGESVLGVVLDQCGIALVEYLLEGLDSDEVVARMERDYDVSTDERRELFEVCSILRKSHAFKHLLAVSDPAEQEDALTELCGGERDVGL